MISDTVINLQGRKLHFVGDFLEVFLNLRQWNQEILNDHIAKEIWGKRTITYFVFDPYSRRFAPSKFCAYIEISERTLAKQQPNSNLPRRQIMTTDFYMMLDGNYSHFDGHRARTHLTNSLGMNAVKLSKQDNLSTFFEKWLDRFKDSVRVHPKGPIILIPPYWFK